MVDEGEGGFKGKRGIMDGPCVPWMDKIRLEEDELAE